MSAHRTDSKAPVKPTKRCLACSPHFVFCTAKADAISYARRVSRDPHLRSSGKNIIGSNTAGPMSRLDHYLSPALTLLIAGHHACCSR
jgi:hypothetical protein